MSEGSTRASFSLEKQIYYLQSIYLQYRQLATGLEGHSLGGEVLADNLDWLDCFIDHLKVKGEPSAGQLFNELLERIDFDGMDPRTFSLAEIERAIPGAKWPDSTLPAILRGNLKQCDDDLAAAEALERGRTRMMWLYALLVPVVLGLAYWMAR